ncbi:assimilatory nitrate reductase (NADH) beta subunit /assimilatory nitrate reductase (NADH) alpha subunit apoprotein [Pontibacter ummariensis]|uniref:nitrate reductase (cytochrome) n=1 Tax=Pontibacter ummariensis TaxID=1610492 RepID=A0A239ESW8_9BACT|nr:nitrate reductase [Pontibacter ummariensis]PRY12763.1 assimilatory nitrate reductase (NADH) beta subunit /assimilatory nitrate reductase (NADH) alpha subunit apoprotein [Pontibacter ummariensis]SNS47727.1 ferredoxin-nitrate reductase [Pontibacter ummariensis]
MSVNTQYKDTFTSTCCYCGVGCGVVVSKEKNGTVTVEGDKDYSVNKGMLCSKGMNLQYTVNDKRDRLLYPQMRYNKNMPMQRVGWEEALQRTAAVFSTFIKKYGPESVAFYASGQCLTEEYYVINKLIKGFIGSNNIDTNSRLCMSSAVAGYKMALGEDSVPICYDDIELADCFYVTGANPAWCHPILWRRVEAHKATNPDVKIIVVDPRVTDSCAIADLHLQLNPGTDVVLNHAIGRVLIENGDIDLDFVRNHAQGFEQYREVVFQRTLGKSAEICGVSEEDIRLAAKYIGNAKGFISMWTMGLNQSAIGVNKNLSLLNLNLITGHIGKPGSGPFSLTGQPNAMGGREVGGLSNLLAAHRNLNDPAHREEVQKFWGGTAISEKPGLTATEMFEALNDGRLKAIWILCSNPLTSLPNARMAEEGLKKARFVVVQEISNKPETLSYADVILPAAAWTEKEGTMTNSERRITYLNKITDAPGEALPDVEIICRFARKMGYKGFDYASASEIYQEHARLTAGTNIDISGLSYAVLKEKRSVQWPYPSGERAAGTPRLFSDKIFYTPSKKAIIHPVPVDFRSEQPDEDYPLILTTGRIRDQWHTMSKTGKVNKLKKHISQAFLEIHPADAAQLQLTEGEMALISSRRGEVRVKAKVSENIKQGVVFLPMHWGKILGSDLNRANNVTSELLDPVSKEPDFKYCAVRVERYKKPFQRIVVVGAGAGAYGFVKSYRALNQIDEITIFSKEDFPFYNRVMLPDYISGQQRWEQLVKMKDSEEPDYHIRLLRGVSVEKVDRENKFVVDSRGVRTEYDVLIMATGSRAAMPKHVPSLPGIFTMRSRTDADNFKSHLPANANVVIVGGGLLGLEMAASLREIGTKVTIIQRISRFLDRQLDPLGSQLLQEEMVDQGCDLYFNDEVQLYYGRSKLTGVGLKSGHRIDCDAMIIAIGTVPNLELARECGLECKRGVLVNERLQTSDPNIFAIGEIAEFEGVLYGITAAAEQQADVVARYLSGDIASYYEGSTFMNIIKIHGFDLCSIGLPESPDNENYEEIVFIDKAKRYYKKCIIHQDRLVGAILIGDKSEFQEYRELISNKIELSEKRLQLLRSGSKAEPVLGRLVCSCNNVGSENLRQKIAGGCTDFKELCVTTGAGTGCGSCRPEVKQILDDSLKLDLLEQVG